ncbi:hypothetical protein, partial [Kocuria rhizophila]|uniref:hypothetical protein n=1 Tax=Kocuria rhizophila TaxID=72000 RepID=UPI001C92C28B
VGEEMRLVGDQRQDVVRLEVGRELEGVWEDGTAADVVEDVGVRDAVDVEGDVELVGVEGGGVMEWV